MPVVAVLGTQRRFSELRAALPGVTPRALALKDLERAGLVERRIVGGYPPTALYRPTPASLRLRAILVD